TLTAARLPMSWCSPRNTVPMPPAPIVRMIRYWPIWVGTLTTPVVACVGVLSNKVEHLCATQTVCDSARGDPAFGQIRRPKFQALRFVVPNGAKRVRDRSEERRVGKE